MYSYINMNLILTIDHFYPDYVEKKYIFVYLHAFTKTKWMTFLQLQSKTNASNNWSLFYHHLYGVPVEFPSNQLNEMNNKKLTQSQTASCPHHCVESLVSTRPCSMKTCLIVTWKQPVSIQTNWFNLTYWNNLFPPHGHNPPADDLRIPFLPPDSSGQFASNNWTVVFSLKVGFVHVAMMLPLNQQEPWAWKLRMESALATWGYPISGPTKLLGG